MSVAVIMSRSIPNTSSSYTFETSPRSVPVNRASKKKYREPNEPESLQSSKVMNMMSDRRIRRGPTVPPPITQRTIDLQKQEEDKQRKEALRKQRERLRQQAHQLLSDRPETPQAIDGRQRMYLIFIVISCKFQSL